MLRMQHLSDKIVRKVKQNKNKNQVNRYLHKLLKFLNSKNKIKIIQPAIMSYDIVEDRATEFINFLYVTKKTLRMRPM